MRPYQTVLQGLLRVFPVTQEVQGVTLQPDAVAIHQFGIRGQIAALSLVNQVSIGNAHRQ